MAGQLRVIRRRMRSQLPLGFLQLLPQLGIGLAALGQLQHPHQLLLRLLQLLAQLRLGVQLLLGLLQLLTQLSQSALQLAAALLDVCRLLLSALPAFAFLRERFGENR